MKNLCVIGLLAMLGLANTAPAQIVQLPSVSNFSYSGGGWVPDAGSVGLAGNSYASSGASSAGWGPYRSRASGSVYGTSSVSASVQIIDIQALDDAILSTAGPASKRAVAAPLNSTASDLATPSGRSVVGSYSAQGAGPNIDPGKWQRVLAGGHPSMPAHSEVAESDIRHYLKMGQEAEAVNRVVAARVYYRMAAEAMTPEMRERYESILAQRAEAARVSAAQIKADRLGF
jgi:hypothetical protein